MALRRLLALVSSLLVLTPLTALAQNQPTPQTSPPPQLRLASNYSKPRRLMLLLRQSRFIRTIFYLWF